MTSEIRDTNPLRDRSDGRFEAWLLDLNDGEVIELLNLVSSDLKRRNLLTLPSGKDGEKAIKLVVDAVVGKDGV